MERKTPNLKSVITASVGAVARCRLTSQIAVARARVSRHLSRRLPYYLTPKEAHRIISATENARDHLFLRLLWETGVRVSEAIAARLGYALWQTIKKRRWKECAGSPAGGRYSGGNPARAGDARRAVWMEFPRKWH